MASFLSTKRLFWMSMLDPIYLWETYKRKDTNILKTRMFLALFVHARLEHSFDLGGFWNVTYVTQFPVKDMIKIIELQCQWYILKYRYNSPVSTRGFKQTPTQMYYQAFCEDANVPHPGKYSRSWSWNMSIERENCLPKIGRHCESITWNLVKYKTEYDLYCCAFVTHWSKEKGQL